MAGDKTTPQNSFEQNSVFSLTFPDHHRTPPEALQFVLVAHIPRDVAGELALPKFGTGFWCRGVSAARVTVPEASVHEDGGVVFGKNEIRRARQSLAMKTEA